MSSRPGRSVLIACLALTQSLSVGAQPSGGDAKAPADTGKQARTDQYGDPLPPGAVARLGTTRFRDVWIGSLAFTPDGRTLISGSRGGVAVWDAATGKEVRRIRPETDSIQERVSVSADGKLVAVASGPGRPAAVYEVATGRRVCRIGDGSYSVAPLAFSPDGKVLAAHSGGPIYLYDSAKGNLLLDLEGHREEIKGFFDSTRAAVFTPDGKTLISAGNGPSVCFWDVATGKEVRRLKDNLTGVAQMALSPDGKRLATQALTRLMSADGGGTWYNGNRVRVWDVASGKEVRRLVLPSDSKEAHPHGPSFLAFTPDGKALVTDGPKQALYLWDAETGKDLRRLEGPRGWGAFAFAPDGKRFAVLEHWQTIHVYDTADGRELVPTGGHRNAVTAAAVSPDGRVVATGGDFGVIRLWDPLTGREFRRVEAHKYQVTALTFSADGRGLFSVGHDDDLRVWDPGTGRRLHRHEGHVSGVRMLARSQDGKALAVPGERGKVYLLDGATGKKLRALDGAGAIIYAASFSPDGRTLLAWTYDRGLHRWDLATGKHSRVACDGQPENVFRAAFSPDGRLVAFLGQADYLPLVDTETGREVCRFENVTRRPDASALALAFAPDGRSLAWCGVNGGVVCLGEVASGCVRHGFAGHYRLVPTLVFSADGNLLISGGEDTTALTWDVRGRWQAPPSVAKGLGRCWDDLADEDAARSYQAMRALASSPAEAVALLKDRLPPVAGAGPARLAGLIAALDGDTFGERERASRELEKFGLAAEPALHRALAAGPTLEARRRIERLLVRLEGPEQLRRIRAVEVLEGIGSPEARRVLEQLAGGLPEARLTREARAAMGRLVRRPPATP
jgi:WD40 repeat protein